MPLPMLRAAAEVVSEWDDPADDECCVFVQAVIERAFALDPAELRVRSMWRIFDVTNPWSPIDAAAAVGVTDVSSKPPHELAPMLGRWHVVQGWRGEPGAKGVTGHTFLWLAATPATGVVLDASNGRSPDQVLRGFRSWADVTAAFRRPGGGVALASLRGPPRIPRT